MVQTLWPGTASSELSPRWKGARGPTAREVTSAQSPESPVHGDGHWWDLVGVLASQSVTLVYGEEK